MNKIFFLFVYMVSLPCISLAQSLDCTRVLSEKVVNSRSTVVSERLISDLRRDICDETFESAGAVKNYARSGGWNFDMFDIFDNSLQDNKQKASGSYNIKRTQFCSLSSANLSRTLGINHQETNGQFVLEAFQACVQTTSSNSVYFQYELVGLGKDQKVDGEIHRTVSKGSLAYDIEGVSFIPTDAGVSCEVASQKVPDNLSRNNPIEVKSTPISLTCSKTKDVTTIVTVQTSEGSFSVTSPSQAEDERTAELISLNGELAGSLATITELQDALTASEKEKTSLSDGHNAVLRENNILRRRHNANLYTIYAGAGLSGALQGKPDFHARCGTVVDRNYGVTQCNSKNMSFWSLKKVGTYLHGDPAGCGQVWYALLCQAR